MRLGAYFERPERDPEAWAAQILAKGYRAAYSPFRPKSGEPMPPESDVAAFRGAAARSGIVIAEVGAWGRNPLSGDAAEREQAIEETAALLDLADRIGARCAVNGAGWTADPADGFSDATFAAVVDATRRILDRARPRDAFFTLEFLPNVFPHSVESGLALIAAVDRPRFGIHLDPVNLIDGDFHYYRNADLLRDCFRAFGPLVRSCHAKDVLRRTSFLPQYDEVPPGKGVLDYCVFLAEIDRLDPDLPLMIEHLETDAEYDAAAAYIRSRAGG